MEVWGIEPQSRNRELCLSTGVAGFGFYDSCLSSQLHAHASFPKKSRSCRSEKTARSFLEYNTRDRTTRNRAADGSLAYATAIASEGAVTEAIADFTRAKMLADM